MEDTIDTVPHTFLCHLDDNVTNSLAAVQSPVTQSGYSQLPSKPLPPPDTPPVTAIPPCSDIYHQHQSNISALSTSEGDKSSTHPPATAHILPNTCNVFLDSKQLQLVKDKNCSFANC